MKSIKYNIMVSYCIVGAVIITIMSMVITIKLNKQISTQSTTLSSELLTLINQTLVGHHNIFLSTIDTIKEDLESISKDIARHPNIVENISALRVTAVTGIIESFKNDKMDFIVILNLEGNHVASYPSDTAANVDIHWIENHYRNNVLYNKAKHNIMAGSENSQLTLFAISKQKNRFLKAFTLADKYPGQTECMVLETAGIITDDFSDPIAIIILGKILNNYTHPLMEFYNNTGSSCAIYLNTFPIVHAGFNTGLQDSRISANELEIKPDIINEVYASNKPKFIPMVFSGNTYITICSAITATSGEKIGIYSVGIPESRIQTIKSNINELGTDTKKEIHAWIVLISIIALSSFIFMSFAIAVRIVRPLSEVTHMIKDIAQGEGDLTKRLDVTTRNELGVLAGWFNKFMDKLQGIITDIMENTKTLNTASRNLSGMSGQMTEKTNDMTEKTQSTSSASEELSASMNWVSSGTEEMTSTIHDIARRASHADAIMNEAALKAGSTSDIMNKLGAAAREIGNVTETITKISEQTNLLALNATIEAARAGEFGKGFAVVANEIKLLAKQTSDATDEIRGKIEAIQGSAESTIDQIQMISNVITEMNETVTIIAASIEEQTTTTNEISKNIGKNSVVADLIKSDITDIKDNINEMSDISTQLKHHSDELFDLSDMLKKMVDQFNV